MYIDDYTRSIDNATDLTIIADIIVFIASQSDLYYLIVPQQHDMTEIIAGT